LLTQVITNLISNAIKFSPDGKSICIYANIFNDRFVEFIVKDEGLGISEANKSKLFKIEKCFLPRAPKANAALGSVYPW